MNQVKVSVFLYKLVSFISSVKKSLEKIQAESQGQVQFVFYDSKDNQMLQNQYIDKTIEEGTDILLVNLVDIGEAQSIVNKVKENNIPVIFFNREPRTLNPIKSYDKVLYIGGNEKEAGILQGEILIDEWSAKKQIIDRNSDDIMQYVILQGESDNKSTIERTKYSINTIKEAGIKTEEIALRVANWDEELARKAMEVLLFRYGNRIEVVIANSDDMAIGAINTLQSIGYNSGDENRTIPVVGIDAIEEARDLIAKGFMTGTVIQDSYELAEVLYLVAMNMVVKKNPIQGTKYVLDETGVAIRLPYKEYIKIGTLTRYALGDNYRNKEEPNSSNIVKASVLLRKPRDPYIEEIRKDLEGIQAENPDKIQFEFYYTDADQVIQNQILDMVLEEGVDLIIIQLADIARSESVINKVKETNIPVVLFNREPLTLDPIRSYSKSLFIGTDGREAGVLQGKIIVDEWNNNRINVDRNSDGRLQYIMLTGESGNKEAIERTKYSILTVNGAGIKTEELALRVANFDKELAKQATQPLFFKYGNNIEAIIANNDAMAIGAIEVLQEFGYNKGDESRTILVVGVDAIDEAKELTAKGYMTGTVIQDAYEMARAIYLTGMNLVSGRHALEGTPYVFDETGVAIRIPYREYIKA